MQQWKWHQLETQAIGIQITPASRTRPTLGSGVGATTEVVRTRALSTSTTTLVMRAASARFGSLSACWTDEVSQLCG